MAFARATLAFADALGIDRFALFGMHTGGLIGMHLGWIAPERLSALVIDGYALFNDAERARYTDKYLPPFVPSWDGGHLRWLWSRMREQLYFFPWCDPSADCAIVLPPYTPEARTTRRWTSWMSATTTASAMARPLPTPSASAWPSCAARPGWSTAPPTCCCPTTNACRRCRTTWPA
jgi:hypothetical protein